MQRRATSALIALLLAMSGCASGPLEGSVWPERSPLGRTLDTVRPSPDPKSVEGAEPAAEPSGAISLNDALAAALLRSPAL